MLPDGTVLDFAVIHREDLEQDPRVAELAVLELMRRTRRLGDVLIVLVPQGDGRATQARLQAKFQGATPRAERGDRTYDYAMVPARVFQGDPAIVIGVVGTLVERTRMIGDLVVAVVPAGVGDQALVDTGSVLYRDPVVPDVPGGEPLVGERGLARIYGRNGNGGG